FLEEVANQQAARMAQWVGKVTGWYRATLDSIPGPAQSTYWLKNPDFRKEDRGKILGQIDPPREVVRRQTDVKVVVSWLLQNRAGLHGRSDRKTELIDQISEYVGTDIPRQKYALSQAAVELVRTWVADPDNAIPLAVMTDRVLERVLRPEIVAIAGKLVEEERRVAGPKLSLAVGAQDPWPYVAVFDKKRGNVAEARLTATLDDLRDKHGFDTAGLTAMKIEGSARFQKVMWKLISREGNTYTLQRQSPVLG
ncbi:MAG TPA: hypothetical protein VF625_09625, partial [Longimicrobium sp.]